LTAWEKTITHTVTAKGKARPLDCKLSPVFVLTCTHVGGSALRGTERKLFAVQGRTVKDLVQAAEKKPKKAGLLDEKGVNPSSHGGPNPSPEIQPSWKLRTRKATGKDEAVPEKSATPKAEESR